MPRRRAVSAKNSATAPRCRCRRRSPPSATRTSRRAGSTRRSATIACCARVAEPVDDQRLGVRLERPRARGFAATSCRPGARSSSHSVVAGRARVERDDAAVRLHARARAEEEGEADRDPEGRPRARPSRSRSSSQSVRDAGRPVAALAGEERPAGLAGADDPPVLDVEQVAVIRGDGAEQRSQRSSAARRGRAPASARRRPRAAAARRIAAALDHRHGDPHAAARLSSGTGSSCSVLVRARARRAAGRMRRADGHVEHAALELGAVRAARRRPRRRRGRRAAARRRWRRAAARRRPRRLRHRPGAERRRRPQGTQSPARRRSGLPSGGSFRTAAARSTRPSTSSPARSGARLVERLA